MSSSAAEMARRLREEITHDADKDEVANFLLTHFAKATVSDLERALELWREMDRIEEAESDMDVRKIANEIVSILLNEDRDIAERALLGANAVLFSAPGLTKKEAMEHARRFGDLVAGYLSENWGRLRKARQANGFD